jgi:hypothetical protein
MAGDFQPIDRTGRKRVLSSRIVIGGHLHNAHVADSFLQQAQGFDASVGPPGGHFGFSLEIEGAALPRVNQADDEDRDKDCGLDEADYSEFTQFGGPWIEEDNFNVENKK